MLVYQRVIHNVIGASSKFQALPGKAWRHRWSKLAIHEPNDQGNWEPCTDRNHSKSRHHDLLWGRLHQVWRKTVTLTLYISFKKNVVPVPFLTSPAELNLIYLFLFFPETSQHAKLDQFELLWFVSDFDPMMEEWCIFAIFDGLPTMAAQGAPIFLKRPYWVSNIIEWGIWG